MPIFKGRRRGEWKIQVELPRGENGKRKRLLRNFRGSHKEAQTEEAKLRQNLQEGRFVEPSEETLGHFLRRWLAYIESRRAPSTCTLYRFHVEVRWVPALGHVRLRQLQSTDIVRVEQSLLEGGRLGLERGTGKALSAKTVLNIHRTLATALNQAVIWKLLPLNPADAKHMEPPKWEHKEALALDEQQVVKLFEEFAKEAHGIALHTLLATGLRSGEVLGLRWRDVDLEGGVVRVQQQWDKAAKTYRDVKSHRSRRPVPIDSDLISALRRHRTHQLEVRLAAGSLWQDLGLAFTDRLGGGLTHNHLRHALDRCLERAGLGHLSPHGLRHTHASILIAAGTHMKLIQERLGHASYQVTADTYSHVAPALGRQAAEDFGRILRRGDTA